MIIIGREHILSNICSHEEFTQFLEEVRNRYKKAKEGYEFNFKTEIEPFLKKSEHISECIMNSESDSRFTPLIKEKVTNTTTELAMNCHVKRFSKKLFNETYKYVAHWFFYLNERESE